MRHKHSIYWEGFAAALITSISFCVFPAQAQNFYGSSATVNLGPITNSGVNNQHLAISKDGLSVNYSSDQLAGLESSIYEQLSPNADWGMPQSLGAYIISACNDFSPAFTPNGHWLYFYSNCPGGCGPADTMDLYVSHRKDKRNDFGWAPDESLG